jgi:hypothetical protein
MDYRLTPFVRAVGVLYAVTGALMVVAPAFAARPIGSWLPVLWILGLGLVVVAAGIGLLRRSGWAWPLAFAIAASGAVVVAVRLWLGGPWAGLSATLVTNVLCVVALLAARRRPPI